MTIEKFLAWADRRNFISVRAFTQYFTLYMTYQVTLWVVAFANSSRFDGMETAAIIGAVTAPFTALLGFVFNSYTKGRT